MADGSASVLGGHGEVHVLSYDTTTNLALARGLAGTINAGILKGTIQPADNNKAPTVTGGQHEYVQTTDGVVTLPGHYGAVVLDTANATVTGSADQNQIVLAGKANVVYHNLTTDASGVVVLGGGKDVIDIGAKNSGNWVIEVGLGADTINALGTGAYSIRSEGALTLTGGAGTIIATGGKLGENLFNAGSGNETLSGGGTSRDTFHITKESGHITIKDFDVGDTLKLDGFDAALTTSVQQFATTKIDSTVELSDHTKITFTHSI